MKYDRDLAAIEYHDEKQKRRTFPTQVELLWEKKVLAVEAKFAFFPISSGEREKSSQINGTFRIRLKKCIRIFAVPCSRDLATLLQQKRLQFFALFVSAGPSHHRFAGGLWQRWHPFDLRTSRFPGGGHQLHLGYHRPTHFHCLPLRWKPFRSGNKPTAECKK